jgi:uncharacterized protein YegP (UPF0339 family)
MNSKYQVYRDKAGKFRFRLRAANNKIVAVSEAYESKAGCINGIKSVQGNCNSPIQDKTIEFKDLSNPKYEVFKDIASKFRFNLKAPNGEIIAASEAYQTKQNVLRGIEAVQNSCNAEIQDLTIDQEAEEVTGLCEEPAEGLNDTVLELYCPPSSVDSGSTVKFKGKLTMSDSSKGVSCVKIEIYEEDPSFMKDDLIALGMTENDGTFSIDWLARQMDNLDDSVEIYAKFSGTENYKASKSELYKMRVLWYAKRK